MNYVVSTIINRPQAEVFGYVTHFENHPQWQAATIENTQITPGPMGVGTEMRHVGKWLGRRHQGTAQVTEFEPISKWAYKTLTGPFDLKMRYSFEKVPTGTRLTMFVDGDDNGFFRLAGPILVRLATRLQQSDLARLKKVLEAGQ